MHGGASEDTHLDATLLTTFWRGRTLNLERSQPDGAATAARDRLREGRCERMKDGAP